MTRLTIIVKSTFRLGRHRTTGGGVSPTRMPEMGSEGRVYRPPSSLPVYQADFLYTTDFNSSTTV